MTNYMNYIKNIINTETEMDKDSIEKLVKIAYYMGREEAAREVSDKYSDHIAEQKQRASADTTTWRRRSSAMKIIFTPATMQAISQTHLLTMRSKKSFNKAKGR